MVATRKSLYELTAADLQGSRLVVLSEGMPLRDAAVELAKAGVHGAPVVNDDGRCCGVLSVSDIVRWALRKTGPIVGHPQTCGYQETHRGLGGAETKLCTLPQGKCPFQSPKHLATGEVAMECREPHSVLFEWQMVEMESLPTEDVRHYMTAEPIMVGPESPIRELARLMANSNVQRVIVIDGERRPIGIVSSTDLIVALAAFDDDEP